jgi:hypothetical protein
MNADGRVPSKGTFKTLGQLEGLPAVAERQAVEAVLAVSGG